MSSTFDAEFAASVIPEILTEFGEPAAYTPVGGLVRSIVISVTKRKTEKDFERSQERSELKLETFCKTSSTDGISEPRKNDRLVFDGTTWRFDQIITITPAGVSILWTASQDVTTRGN